MPWRTTKSRSHGVKNGVMGTNHGNTHLCLVNTQEATFLVQSSRKLVKSQNHLQHEVSDKFESGSCGLEN